MSIVRGYFFIIFACWWSLSIDLSLYRPENIDWLDNNSLFQDPIQSASLLQTMVTRWWKVSWLEAKCSVNYSGDWPPFMDVETRSGSFGTAGHDLLPFTWSQLDVIAPTEAHLGWSRFRVHVSKHSSSNWITQETMRQISRIMVTSGTLVLWMYSVSIMTFDIVECARVGAQIILHQW